MRPSPYDVLGVSPDATDDELREAYRTSARKLHPDRHQGDKRAEEAMRRVNEAWSLVGSPVRRRAYHHQFGFVPTIESPASYRADPWEHEKQPVSRIRHVGVLSMVAILLIISVFSAYARVAPNPPLRFADSPNDGVCLTNQVISGTSGNDVLVGTPGDDVICGGDGNDRVDGQGGNDTIVGGPGNDLLIGGAGNDKIMGGPGDNTLMGGPGDDQFIGDVGTDTADGGAGLNRCYGIETVTSCEEPGPFDPPASDAAAVVNNSR
jgi:DnaJ domain/RTX calcium-binding nonapeptide repeat (4 copies)